MKDPELKAEYDALTPQYEIMSKLIDAHKREHITQKDLAERTGIKQTNISRFENGKVNPSIEFLERLALALGYTLDIQVRRIK